MGKLMYYLMRLDPPWDDSDVPGRVRRSNMYGLLFLVTVSLLVSLVELSGSLDTTRTSRFERSDIQYDSRSVLNRTKPVEFRLRKRGEPSAMRMSLDFKCYSIGASDNIMQTGPGNRGLRLELSPPGNLVVIAGYHERDEYGAYGVSSGLTVGVWHHLDVNVNREDRITIRFDGRVVADATDASLGYDTSDVVFGTGFSKTRPFDGVIDDGSFVYETFRKTLGADAIIFYAECVLLVSSVVFLFLGSNARLIAPRSDG